MGSLTVRCGDYVRKSFGHDPRKENKAYVEFSGYAVTELTFFSHLGIFNPFTAKLFIRGEYIRIAGYSTRLRGYSTRLFGYSTRIFGYKLRSTK